MDLHPPPVVPGAFSRVGFDRLWQKPSGFEGLTVTLASSRVEPPSRKPWHPFAVACLHSQRPALLFLRPMQTLLTNRNLSRKAEVTDLTHWGNPSLMGRFSPVFFNYHWRITMADNYDQSTVEPDFPIQAVSEFGVFVKVCGNWMKNTRYSVCQNRKTVWKLYADNQTAHFL
jgi:hypothetical protein